MGEGGMDVDDPLVKAAESVQALITPSAVGVETTFAALGRTVETVHADCRTIAETLEALGDALSLVSQGAGAGQEWGGFGLISLPIVGAIRAVKAAASQYVSQQTGIPLTTWTELVTSSSSQFDEYLSQLDIVAELSLRYHDRAQGAVDPERARQDVETLLHVLWETQAWKQILGRVAQLGKVVEAILQIELGGDPLGAEMGSPSGSASIAGSLQKRFKEVQSRTVERSGDLREWVLQPFEELRDRVKQLPGQTEHLAHEVALLEVMLELEIAEVQALFGDISRTEARVVGMRAAASVILPELADRLGDARHRVSVYEAYLDRLTRAHQSGQVGDRTYSVLAEEYHEALRDSRSRLSSLEAQAEGWRHDGATVLDACDRWTKLQLDLLAARRLAEQAEVAGDRLELLHRERERLAEARTILSAL
jgi:hypothetical protein